MSDTTATIKAKLVPFSVTHAYMAPDILDAINHAESQDAIISELTAEVARLREVVDNLRPMLGECVDGENYRHGIKGTTLAKRRNTKHKA